MLTQLAVWSNAAANACAGIVLAPVAWLPGWLSSTAIAAVTGVLMLVTFKYTSNQAALKSVRRGINANALALSLFRDSVMVSLKCQGRILLGAGRLLSLGLVPMAVMCVPVCLLLVQLAVWYQARPLRVGEDTVITVHLPRNGLHDTSPNLQLAPCAAIEPAAGPVRVPEQCMICWNLRAKEPGYHVLTFEAGSEAFEKEIAVGDGFMRVSPRRPGWNWTDVLLNPSEPPFSVDCRVEAIDIAYPERTSWTAGTSTWLLYWFVTSMLFAFLLRPVLKVNL